MKPLTANIIEWKNRLADNTPWVDLLEINMGSAGIVYLCNDNATINYDAGDGAHDYTPFPFVIPEVKEDGGSNLSPARVAVADVFGVIKRLQIETQAFTGRDVTLHRFYRDGEVAFKVIARVTRWGSKPGNIPTVGFELGYEHLTRTEFPARKYRRNCGKNYGDPATCKFPAVLIGTGAGQSANCDLTLAGANGCLFHGKLEADASQPVLHPKLFGGFEGTLPT